MLPAQIMRATRSSLCLAAAAIISIAVITIAPRPSRAVVETGPVPVRPVAFSAEGPTLLDPDHVGPCPVPGYSRRVLRRGMDELGRASWWGLDGSVLRWEICEQLQGGVTVEVPKLVFVPARNLRRASSPAVARIE